MLDFFKNLLGDFGEAVLQLLPDSPFHAYIVYFEDMAETPLKWLNWLIPIGDFLTIGAAWLVAISLFYIYSVIMRWIKLIGD